MTGGTPSLTAWGVARRRAAHQVLDSPKVFEDPLALRITGGEWRPRAEEPEALSRRLRAFIAARSRYAEDCFAASGLRQIVILGAGLDTFAYRNTDPGLRVFEVDHPATQEWKRELLGRAAIPVPESLVYVPVDFEAQSLDERLAAAGISRDPTFFSWLGVAPYLTREAFDGTIAYIARMPSGSGVVFDYAQPLSVLPDAERAAVEALARRVARAGEPFRLFFEPEPLARDLWAAGLGKTEDLGGREIDDRYFAGRSDGLAIGTGAARLLSAFSICS